MQFSDDPAFRQFEQAVFGWQTDWRTCEQFHEAAEEMLRGEEGRQDVKALLRAIALATPDAPHLYRGMWLPATEWEVVAESRVGSDLHLPIASFTSAFNWACEFAWLARNEGDGTEIVLCLEPGAKAVRIDLLAPDEIHWREREWITGGRFVITASEYVSEADRVELTIVHEGYPDAT